MDWQDIIRRGSLFYASREVDDQLRTWSPILLYLVTSEELNLLFALIAMADLIVPGIMMNRKRA